MELILHIVVSAALLFIVGKMVDGIDVEGPGAAIFGAIILGLANFFVRPVLLLLTLPITVLTLGLFIWVVNALILLLVARLVPGFRVRGFGPALLGSLLLAILNWGVGVIF
ncbi:MAG: phage holin family protein [Gemmatimonadales bacterium]|jgi:putative membrane protein|nr:MAG: phage holin family protein [Gemmatimonadales bacterium]